RHQVAQVLLGLLGDRNVGIAAVAHFHYRQPTALPIKKLGLGAAQHRFGKRGGAGAKVKGAFAHCCFSHARCSDSPQGYKRLAGRSSKGSATSTENRRIRKTDTPGFGHSWSSVGTTSGGTSPPPPSSSSSSGSVLTTGISFSSDSSSR